MQSTTDDRQSILNNQWALKVIEQHLDLKAPVIEDEIRLSTQQVALFYDVDERTIRRYVEKHGEELSRNWYELFVWERLKKAKEVYVQDMNVLNINKKSPQVWFFTFRSFLNIWMLLKESEVAKQLRQTILDIVMNYLNEKWWGTTKYINVNDDAYLTAYKDNIYYRETFLNALKEYIDGGNHKYDYFTDLIYQAIFLENSQEYKLLLKMEKEEDPRHSLYAEVLVVVSQYENWFAHELETKSTELGRKLTELEAKQLFNDFRESPVLEPAREQARTLMASRDKALRQIIHEKLEPYIKTLWKEEYEKFCYEFAEFKGEKNKEMLWLMDENKDIFLRLSDK